MKKPLKDLSQIGYKDFLVIMLFLSIFLSNNVNAWSFITDGYGTINDFDSLDIMYDGSPCFVYTYTSNLILSCRIDTNFVDQTIYDNASAITDISLAIDNADISHVCAVFSNDSLYYGQIDISASEVLNWSYLTDNVDYCDIDTDINNKPHITYSDTTRVKETFLSASGSWTTSDVINVGGLGVNIKIGTDGYKHIIGFGSGGSLTYAQATSPTSTTWIKITDIANSLLTAPFDMQIHNNLIYATFRNWSGGNYVLFHQTEEHTNTSWSYAFTEFTYPFSIDLYNGNVYGSFISGSNLYSVTNETGSFIETSISGSSTGQPSLKIDISSGEKWIAYTTDDTIDYIKLAREDYASIYLTGTLTDCITTNPISAIICADETNCNYTSASGSFRIGEPLSEGVHTLSITPTITTYYNPRYMNISLDGSEVPLCLYSKNISNSSVSTITLYFRDQLTHLPLSNLSVTIEYMDCLSGCTACCSYSGTILTGKTDSVGKIIIPFLKGTYKLSISGGYDIWDDGTQNFEDEVYFTADTSYYSQTFDILKVDHWKVIGNVYDSVSYGGVSGANIVIYNSYRQYNATSNASGYFEVNNIERDTYNSSCFASGYIQLEKIIDTEGDLSDIPCIVFGVETDCYYTFQMLLNTTSTYKLNGTILDRNNNSISDAKIILFPTSPSGRSAETYSSASGLFEITNLPADIYYIRIIKSGFDTFNGQVTINKDTLNQKYYLYNTSQVVYYCLVVNVTDGSTGTAIDEVFTQIAPSNDFTSSEIGYNLAFQDGYTSSLGLISFCNLRKNKHYDITLQRAGYSPNPKIEINIPLTINNSQVNINLSTEGLMYTWKWLITNCLTGEGYSTLKPSGIAYFFTSSQNITNPNYADTYTQTQIIAGYTDADGYSFSVDLPAGTYYVYILWTPSNFYDDPFVYIGRFDVPDDISFNYLRGYGEWSQCAYPKPDAETMPFYPDGTQTSGDVEISETMEWLKENVPAMFVIVVVFFFLAILGSAMNPKPPLRPY